VTEQDTADTAVAGGVWLVVVSRCFCGWWGVSGQLLTCCWLSILSTP
jgi:hypothetical protein